MTERILSKEEKRYTLFPLRYPDIEEFVDKAISQFWIVKSVDLSNDKFEELSILEQNYLKNLLGFFAGSDGIVNDNIDSNFLTEVEVMEIKRFYNFQLTMEDIHNHMYSLLIDTYIKDPIEKDKMFNAIEDMPAVKKKAAWALKWLGNGTFTEKLIAFACVESISFASTFSGIFYFREQNKLPGLCQANAEILRDETLHYEFATYVYNNYIENKLTKERITEIVLDCLDTELTFVEETMPTGLLGLSSDMMKDYCRYVADVLLYNLKCETVFNLKQPLEYMEKLSIPCKTNFFERKVIDYTRPTSTEIKFGNLDF